MRPCFRALPTSAICRYPYLSTGDTGRSGNCTYRILGGVGCRPWPELGGAAQQSPGGDLSSDRVARDDWLGVREHGNPEPLDIRAKHATIANPWNGAVPAYSMADRTNARASVPLSSIAIQACVVTVPQIPKAHAGNRLIWTLTVRTPGTFSAETRIAFSSRSLTTTPQIATLPLLTV